MRRCRISRDHVHCSRTVLQWRHLVKACVVASAFLKTTPEETQQGMLPGKLALYNDAVLTFVSLAEHWLKRTRCRHSIARDLCEP